MKRAPAQNFGRAGLSVGIVLVLIVTLADQLNRGASMWSAGLTMVLIIWHAKIAGSLIGRGLEDQP